MELAAHKEPNLYGTCGTETTDSPEEHVTEDLKRTVRWLVCAALYVDYALMTVVIPILPNVLQDNHRGVEDWTVFLLMASKGASQLVANQFVGSWVDRDGSYAPLELAFLVLLGSTSVFALGVGLTEVDGIPSWVCYVMLLLARCVQGAASSLVMSAGMALVMGTHSPDESGEASGFVMTGLAAGVITGPLMGGGILAILPGWCAFVPLLVVLVLVWWKHSQIDPWLGCHQEELEPREEDTEGWALLTDPMVMLVAGVLLLANVAIATAEVIVPWVLKDDPFNYSTFYQGLVSLSASLSYLSLTAGSSWLMQRVIPSTLMLVGLVLAGIGLCVAFIQDGELWSILVGTGMIGASLALVDVPGMPQLQQIAIWRGSNNYGSLYALQDTATCLGFVLGPSIGAMGRGLVKSSYQWVVTPLGFMCLGYAPFLLLLRRVPVPTGVILEEIASTPSFHSKVEGSTPNSSQPTRSPI